MSTAKRGVTGLRLALCAALAALAAGCTQKIPDVTSGEYLRSWGLGSINAMGAYQVGATGRGVTVAMVDCGMQDAPREVLRNVSRDSVDIFAGERSLPATDRHGTYMAAPLGAALDRKGLVGVAYNAELLSVRADFEGGYNGQCAFRASALARAVQYAADRKARVIVLPLQASRPMGPAFETALKNAVDSGAVVVAAAGNRSAAEPTYPAKYAADSRFEGAVVAVGAVSAEGELARWSNRAGPTRSWYLAAPGERVVAECGKKTCRLVSGTSFAAAHVAGALALVMEARPELSGREALALLLKNARDTGEPGADPVYGWGVLDVGKVFAG
ncbi:MAG: S8 family serine peptidase [Phenylobacterium sp.]|uniref:S8 family serine peptidase n=1 Tax=Phenylobacterium sp. TaxID=1871053 RepID=UPI002A272591|nr:S8 family serine peptidase [Phenylobacterium sp.]MDD3838552.1 S8 family serine peptidase [Phenylobacterium sp.]MDX9997755.1 S8 family serine peptidase [Phenylobacterium sp.]